MARRAGISAPIDEGQDKAVTVRPASTANFYVNSLDKGTADGSGDFLINTQNSLFNGFFTRIAVSEVVMDWGIPNIAEYWGNHTIRLYVAISGPNGTIIDVTLADGFYTALDPLQAVVDALNSNPTLIAAGITFSTSTSVTTVRLGSTANFLVDWQGDAAPNALARELFTSSVLYQGPLPLIGQITQN